uniref:Peptidylprolyl isomerase n=1 Tax=Phasianus colchicus TaxID=9054 RepID=A0A669PKX6_PHACC
GVGSRRRAGGGATGGHARSLGRRLPGEGGGGRRAAAGAGPGQARSVPHAAHHYRGAVVPRRGAALLPAPGRARGAGTRRLRAALRRRGLERGDGGSAAAEARGAGRAGRRAAARPGGVGESAGSAGGRRSGGAGPAAQFRAGPGRRRAGAGTRRPHHAGRGGLLLPRRLSLRLRPRGQVGPEGRGRPTRRGRGDSGCRSRREPDVPPEAPLVFEVTLLEVRDGPDPQRLPPAARLRLGAQKRERGNVHFARGDFAAALLSYRLALSALEGAGEERLDGTGADRRPASPPGPHDEELREQRVKCLNNCAAAARRLQRGAEALAAVEAALRLSPDNGTALLRRGQVRPRPRGSPRRFPPHRARLPLSPRSCWPRRAATRRRRACCGGRWSWTRPARCAAGRGGAAEALPPRRCSPAALPQPVHAELSRLAKRRARTAEEPRDRPRPPQSSGCVWGRTPPRAARLRAALTAALPAGRERPRPRSGAPNSRVSAPPPRAPRRSG